jgi:hypothetical protein
MNEPILTPRQLVALLEDFYRSGDETIHAINTHIIATDGIPYGYQLERLVRMMSELQRETRKTIRILD